MKKLSVLYLSGIIIILMSCRKPAEGSQSTNRLLQDSLQSVINKYANDGIPGIQVAIKNSKGSFALNAGYANLQTKKPMNSNGYNWLFSITKTYTASLLMLQKQNGLINLDAGAKTYLPVAISSRIKGIDKITVRMLLNHSSGLIDFSSLPEFLSRQFNDPLHQPTSLEILEMVYGHEPLFEPGSDFEYSNTNYLLLTQIVERVSGQSYAALLKTSIIDPLHLKQTFINLTADQLNLPFADYYFDRNANGQLENVSDWNSALSNACSGWGGIVATANDAILFYEALMKGRVVNAASLNEMKMWIKDSQSSQPDYGLGMEYFQYHAGSTPQMGHEGDGVGGSTMIMYVPDNDTYLFISCTVGRKLGGPFLMKIVDLKNELSSIVARWRN